jgi:DegV family protein with EDD domain
VLRAAQAVEAGEPAAAVADKARQWASRTRLYVDVRTLKYMVRGGRVSRAKGLLAAVLNIKPIISLDAEGKAVALGKSFSRRGNAKKILSMIEKESRGQKVWNYAVVHARNPERAAYYAEKLAGILGKPPLFINEISPVIGVHNGIGVVGVCLMYE